MLYFALQVIIVAATVASCYIFIAALARKYLGHNPTAPSALARIKAWWPGFVKRHIVDDDPFDSIPPYENPSQQAIDSVRAAVKAKTEVCGGPLMFDTPTPCELCPVRGYCRNMDRERRYHMAIDWLKAHRLEP